MSRVVADASALGAIIFREEAAEAVGRSLDGATICVPHLLKLELANVALTKARRDPQQAAELFGRLADFMNRRHQIHWHDVNPVDVAILASLTGLSAYDATYLWLAGWLEADLVTLDRRLASAQER